MDKNIIHINSSCLSEVSFSFTNEESTGSSFSFASTYCLRFFLRTTNKKRRAFAMLRLRWQNDNKGFIQYLEVNLG